MTQLKFTLFLLLATSNFSSHGMASASPLSEEKQEADDATTHVNLDEIVQQLQKQLQQFTNLMAQSPQDQKACRLQAELCDLLSHLRDMKSAGRVLTPDAPETKAIVQLQVNIAMHMAQLRKDFTASDDEAGSSSQNETPLAASLSEWDFKWLNPENSEAACAPAKQRILTAANDFGITAHDHTMLVWNKAIKPPLELIQNILLGTAIVLDIALTGGGFTMSYACSDM